MVEAVREYGGFEEAPAVWGGNKQTAQSPHNPEWMASEAVGFIRRSAASGARRRPFFLYFAGTVPHTPFVLPAAFQVNVTRTPAGQVPFNPMWQQRRKKLLERLTPHGLICRDYRQCHRGEYEGAAGRSTSEAYRQPLAPSDRWLDGGWLYSEQNFEQGRLARLFAVGLAWLDDSIGVVVDVIDELGLGDSSVLVYTADHGASFLGKGHVYEAGIRVPLIVRSAPQLAPDAAGRRSAAPLALVDLAGTILSLAGAPDSELAQLQGTSALPLLATTDVANERSSKARPIFVEIGYGRAVIRAPWKLVLVNDPIDRCKHPVGGSCRNLHGEIIDSFLCNFTANGHMGNRVTGACNMTYDAVARHTGFCDRRQLYHMEDDPLEQHNVVEAHPNVYDELLDLIVTHVRRVEARNPAIANRTPSNMLHQCERRAVPKLPVAARQL